MNTAQALALIEEELRIFLEKKRSQLGKAREEAAHLVDLIRGLIDAGGSRIRPLLCATTYTGAGRELSPEVARVCASLELLHTFALIHDDVIDRGGRRRGIRSIPAAESTTLAILAGDLAFALSDELYFTSGLPSEGLTRAFTHLAEARRQAVAGQYLEQTSPVSDDVGLARTIARLKTAGYSMVAPLLIGADLGGASRAVMRALEGYGLALGEAYQIMDDLLLYGPESHGKDVMADLRNGSPTFVISTALNLASPQDQDVIKKLWGDATASPASLGRLTSAVRDSGALLQTVRHVTDLLSEAKEQLEHPDLDTMDRDAIRVLDTLLSKIRSSLGSLGEEYAG